MLTPGNVAADLLRNGHTHTVYLSGTLSSVADLRTSDSATSVNISWSAPFSLDVTGVDPDIWYSVLI